MSHQRFRAGPSVRLGLDRTVLTEVSSVLARAELMWVFDALAHAGEASSTWFFNAVCAAKPVLPGLVAAACAALGAAAGVALDLTEEAFTAMAGWMVATLLFHAGRFGWTILADRGRSSPAR